MVLCLHNIPGEPLHGQIPHQRSQLRGYGPNRRMEKVYLLLQGQQLDGQVVDPIPVDAVDPVTEGNGDGGRFIRDVAGLNALPLRGGEGHGVNDLLLGDPLKVGELVPKAVPLHDHAGVLFDHPFHSFTHVTPPIRALTAAIRAVWLMSFFSSAFMMSSSWVPAATMCWMTTVCFWPCRQSRAFNC